MAKGRLFLIGALHHPLPTKDQAERGEEPKSEVLVEPKWVVASSDTQAGMLAARMLPDTHTDKLEQVEILVRPF